MRKELIKLILGAVLLLGTLPAVASVVYIGDTLRVGVREAPGNNVPPHAVITSGTKLELLKKQNKYSLIRTEDGTEGWVRSIYLISSPPAKILLKERAAELEESQKRVAELEQNLSSAQLSNRELKQRVELLNDDVYNLHQKVASLTPDNSNQWIYIITIVLTLSALSFTIGILWHKHQVAKKLGGHTL